LTPPGLEAEGVALAALLFNVFVMPRIGRGIYRDALVRRDTGIVAYAAMVLLLILVFAGPYLPVAAAVWAMMAFGDPAAAIAGRTVGGPTLPWNPEKTWVGLLSNWAVAGTASVLVFLFVSRRGPEPVAVAILMIGAGLYAFLESVRSGLDDNIVAALPTALAVYQMGMVWRPGAFPFPLEWKPILVAVGVNAAVAVLMAALRVVSPSGAAAGAIAGFLILAAG
jgi:dolichol kinase